MKEGIINWGTRIGVALALYGLVSSVLYFFDYNIRILMWVDTWGPLVGWGIRLALIVGGAALAFVVSFLDDSNSPEAQAAAAQARAADWARVQQHPRVQQALADLSQHMRVTFGPPPDPQTYQVRHVSWQDGLYSPIDSATNQYYQADDPRVTNVVLYLERADAPQRITVGQDLATRQLTGPHEAHPGTWAMFVGG